MTELTTLEIKNPTSEDFTWRYNGEPYTIKAKESATFVRPVAIHLAKHLSTQMVQGDLKNAMTKKDKENPNAAVHYKISQLAIYDTHERRIALYKILNDETLVLDVIKAYPFKGFIGEMNKYEDFVKKSKEPLKQKESKEDEPKPKELSK